MILIIMRRTLCGHRNPYLRMATGAILLFAFSCVFFSSPDTCMIASTKLDGKVGRMGAVAAIRAPPAALGAMPALEPIYGALLPYSRVSFELFKATLVHGDKGASLCACCKRTRERERKRFNVKGKTNVESKAMLRHFATTIHTLFSRSMPTVSKHL